MTSVFHHFGFTVSDLDRSSQFYTEYFDLVEVERNRLTGVEISESVGVPDADLLTCHLAGQNTILELLQYEASRGGTFELGNAEVGAAHPCLIIDDLDALYERMKADGVRFHAAPRIFLGHTKMAYCLDPDGISIELLEPGAALELSTLLARAR